MSDATTPWRTRSTTRRRGGLTLAEPLAAAGLDEAWLIRVHDHRPEHAEGALLDHVDPHRPRTGDELMDSTDRMCQLVKAIKTYAYMDRGEVVKADVHEGLESTLIILKHKVKHTRIKVKRDYDKSLPQLIMHGSELNQVWTNLIDNAIGALGEQGTITISTLLDQAASGSTSPTTARASPTPSKRVFDPFFTTKPRERDRHGAGHRAADRRAAPPRLADLRHRRGGTTCHVWLPRWRTDP